MDSDVTTNLDSITDSDYTYDSLLDDSVVDSSSISSVDSSADTVTDTYLKGIYENTWYSSLFTFLIFVFIVAVCFGRFIYNLCN